MCPFDVLYLCNRMAVNQVDFKILPSDQFSVYSPQTRSDKVITYFTLLSKLRGDILSVGQEDDPNDIVSAFYSSVGGTQTLHLVKADGSEITASVPEPTVGTVTSVDLTASTGISVSGGPITTSGSITVTNTAPDQVVVLTGAGTTSISGTYPSFTITSNDQFVGTVTSVGLTMPAAFSVANSPVTASGTLAVTAAGLSSQYIRGDGQLANFPTPGGGGSSVNYYLNGSVSQGTFGGDTYYELSKTPIAGAGTNFTRAHGSGDGYIASFITDANDPDQINIPGGNFNLEFYFNSSSSGGSPAFYGELYKVSVSNVFTLIASGSVNPESITGGTTVDQYYTSIAVPQTALLATDRLAIRVYVIVSGKNITLHTENSNFSEVITTFSTGLNSLNGLSDQVQYFAVGTSGTDFAISSSVDTHTFNLPTASATNRGALSSADWTTFNGKASDAFKTIAVTGQSDIVADNATDTLNIVAGSGVTLTTNATTDTLTISATGSGGTVTSVGTSAPLTGGPITTTGTIGITQSGVSTDGYLSSTDWNTFNSKEPALTKGNLTEATSSVLTITGGTGAVIGSGTTIQVSQAGASASGFLSSTDWNTFNNKQGTITLTTTGSTGAATFISNTLNIPNYADQFVGTVTSVAALTLGTTGTDLSSTVVNSTTTPVITLNVPTASATNRGALSSADWTTFNSKEPALTKGNLTEATSAVLTITGGTGAVIGTGTSIQVAQSGASTSGFLSSTDWNTFNGKASNSFTTIAVATQTSIVADSATDTLTIVAGTGVTITTNDSTDTLTISATGSGGTVTSISTTAPITGGPITGTGTIAITQSGAAADGYLSSTDWNTFNGKQNAITLTTTGTTGAATLIGATLNIPNYADQFTGTVTSVAALTLGTTGTDLSSTVVNGTTTPVITLNVPTASAANRGALSSTDWTTFNSKQGAITLTTTGSTGAATFISNTLNIPNYTDQFVGTVTSVNLTAGTRIEVAGGPITTSGSITVTHGVAAGADFTTAQTFEARVLADGGIFEALGEVAIAIGSLEDAASPSSTDFNDGVVIQNVAIDEFGHLLGVGATDLDERYVQNLTAGTGITVSGSPSSTAGLITVTNSDRGSSQNIFKNIAVAGQTTIVADTNDDTLTIVAGTGISVTTNHTTDTLTITNTTASFIPVFAGYSSGGVTLTTDATVYDFKIDTETIIDSSIYSHSTSVDSEEITVLSDGTYEITYSGVLFNANTNTSAAAVVDFKIFKNGVVLDDPLNTAQNVAHINTSNYNYINQISNSYIVELLNNDIIKLTISAAYQGGGSPSPAVKFGFQGSAKNNLTIKKLY